MAGVSRATDFGYSLYEFEIYGKKQKNVEELTPLHFIRLELTDANGNLISDNFYWRNGVTDLDYTALNTLPEAELSCKLVDKSMLSEGKMKLSVKNHSKTVACANRIRLVNTATQERILPVIMSDNYITLMPGEERTISVGDSNEFGSASCLSMYHWYCCWSSSIRWLRRSYPDWRMEKFITGFCGFCR